QSHRPDRGLPGRRPGPAARPHRRHALWRRRVRHGMRAQARDRAGRRGRSRRRPRPGRHRSPAADPGAHAGGHSGRRGGRAGRLATVTHRGRPSRPGSARAHDPAGLALHAGGAGGGGRRTRSRLRRLAVGRDRLRPHPRRGPASPLDRPDRAAGGRRHRAGPRGS
ncbi:hypothetical protein LTR94_032271, partial [Friedmanniomyces endolithicus]